MDCRIGSVSFCAHNHTYSYNGKSLKGITSCVSKSLHKVYPDTPLVKTASAFGIDVHGEVERYYNEGNTVLSTEAGTFVVKALEDFAEDKGVFDYSIRCEVMVSDFETTASKIDVVMETPYGAFLFDIKTTQNFDREYCSRQLSVYQYLYVKNYERTVLGLYVIATVPKRIFHILYRGDDMAKKLLEMNR